MFTDRAPTWTPQKLSRYTCYHVVFTARQMSHSRAPWRCQCSGGLPRCPVSIRTRQKKTVVLLFLSHRADMDALDKDDSSPLAGRQGTEVVVS
jgi:hypothetical protein